MTTFLELQLLKEEEKSLIALATKLNDQLNRLKVEELALQSMLQLEHEEESDLSVKKEAGKPDVKVEVEEHKFEPDNQLDELNLSVIGHTTTDNDATEEDEDDEDADGSDDEQDQLEVFLHSLSQQ